MDNKVKDGGVIKCQKRKVEKKWHRAREAWRDQSLMIYKAPEVPLYWNEWKMTA